MSTHNMFSQRNEKNICGYLLLFGAILQVKSTVLQCYVKYEC